MKNQKGVWIGVSDKNNDPEFIEASKKEFIGLPIVEALSDETTVEKASANRRDFLKYLGFGLGAATVAASCDTPVRHAIPYVTKPDAIVPGVASYYASSFVNGGDYCSVLVKTREGRPIKIEGNPLSSITKGGTSARAQASVLSLYDSNRLKEPAVRNAEGKFGNATWAELDRAVQSKLSGNVRIVTNTVLSPTTRQVMAEFVAKNGNGSVVTYDAVSSSAILEANEASFGEKAIPDYHFDKADVIVSFGADFLGTWISPVEYAVKYAKTRKINDPSHAKMSRHIQVEAGMSMTGSNADNRIQIRPSEMGAAIAALLNELGGGVSAPKLVTPKAASAIKKLAKELSANPGRSIVVSGSNNVGEQILVNKINDLLGSYGSTMDFGAASLQRQGIDKDMSNLIADMKSGNVDTLIVWDCNPAFDLPDSAEFVAGLAKVNNKVAIINADNETSALCDYLAPKSHWLESWGDAEPKRGQYSLIQPVIAPLYNARPGEESLLKWSGNDTPYYDYLKSSWAAKAGSAGYVSAGSFWDSFVHDGVLEMNRGGSGAIGFGADVSAAAAKITKPTSEGLEIQLYETVNMGAGQYANNPWLQEMPDPVMRTVWGNYLSVPIEWNGDDKFRGLNGTGSETEYGYADLLTAKVGTSEATFSTVPQFGQAKNTVSVGLGFGRDVVGRAGKEVGVNVFPWLKRDANGNVQYYNNVEVSGIVGKNKDFACVQYHHTFGVTGEDEGETKNLDEIALSTLIADGYQGSLTNRSILYTNKVERVGELVNHIKEQRDIANHLNDKTLYPYKEYQENNYGQGHHWIMHVDMNACIGCGACTVSCMAENNVPVVGSHEVSRHHEMTWLRIDRYYYGDAENPNVAYQPVMCQHCDNAPCENVCPVNATNHSSEGINQMAYNRCVGTRYCANNCPYKVRRFNWLDYTSADVFGANQNHINGEDPAYYTDNITRMVLNPDVTVRSRGVIEKCSFCTQRLQSGKLTAKAEGRRLRDADVKTACQTACPTGAITFGDSNNKKGEASKAIENPLTYRLLEEINVQSSVYYQARVNNRDESLDA